jgi:hypothetical protein
MWGQEEGGCFVLRRFVIGAALGAAAMYFLDPDNGTRRSSAALQTIDMRLKRLVGNTSSGRKRTITSTPFRENSPVGATSSGTRTRPKTPTN